MGLVNRFVNGMVSRMSQEDKHRLMEDMTRQFLSGMTVEDKQKLLGNIMTEFFSGMSAEDKKKIMSEVTPQLMEGFDMTVIMPQMLMSLMGQGQPTENAPGSMPVMAKITGKTRESDEPGDKSPEP